MAIADLSVKELLLLSRRAEGECARCFTRLAGRVRPPDERLQRLFQEHAAEERAHDDALAQWDLRAEMPLVWRLTENDIDRLLGEHLPALRKEEPEASVDRQAALETVRAVEEEAMCFYRTLSRQARDPESREFFLSMAHREASHLQTFFEDLDPAKARPRYPGLRVTANGNQLVSTHVEARLTDGGVFYPITPSTESGELYQQAFAEGKLNVFGRSKVAIETEGEHAAQGGAIALSVTGRRVVNFTSGQGVVYGLEQYYHAPGKLSTMVIEVVARALTKHALNVHCGHDDVYSALDTGWTILFAKDAQQAADQALILRRVTELSLTPGMNVQDGFLTSHLERTFLKPEPELIREFLGAPEDIIACPTESQRKLFGPTRRRVPKSIDLANPALLGPVQNQEHYMQGVVARRNNFVEPILGFLEESYAEFARLTGRSYGLVSSYRTDDAETVFVSLGSAAENIEAAVDHLRKERGAKVGSIHLNVIRPFPEEAVARALAGRRNVIVLERTDEPMAVENPMTRDLRASLSRRGGSLPRIFSGTYGLGSRDFRPEHILGAYEYADGSLRRQDGKGAADGVSYFVLGVDHPYAVKSAEAPSLLPEGAIAVRFHSIGGWGAITTGKNLGAILGAFSEYLAKRNGLEDREAVHVSANPKYGSEKKGAPTAYFLVAAPERVRVNCDLRHVNVVLCCDPKAFTHTNPLDGMAPGGAFVWESDEAPERAWERIPRRIREQIIEKQIRVFLLPGFDIARRATDRPDLQLRMQGNAFLGAFFRVSPFLEQNRIDADHFREVVRDQYVKKFGRFGEAVVRSNMEVMTQGFDRVREVPAGKMDAPDRSSLRGVPLLPPSCAGCRGFAAPPGQPERPPLMKVAAFDAEFRAGLGYHQPASPLASVGVMAAATGDTASKYVSRRETPVYTPENCTQCMECIAVCPDTALPNTAQDVATVLRAAIPYVTDAAEREKLLAAVPGIETQAREAMKAAVASKAVLPFRDIVRGIVDGIAGVAPAARAEFCSILEKVPAAYSKVNAIFATPEKKSPGAGGLFSIFVSDLCKGCGACVTACGDHEALKMVAETEAVNADHETATAFLNLLPDTPPKYLGLYDGEKPQDSHVAALRNHLMVRRNYEALVAGDGACAGCGEKSVLRSVVSMTEAYMRPLYHAKADRLREKAARLEKSGVERLGALAGKDRAAYDLFRQAAAHFLLGLGGETDEDTKARIAARPPITDGEVVGALVAVMRQEAFNHKELQAVDGRLANGMSVMAMAAHTGCNTVFGSTPPNNPHPYPWMNSLFQDGITVAWLFGESFIMDHARRSVLPERLADALLGREKDVITPREYFDYAHFTDALMTEQEIRELPKVWAVGGDGGMGDIGYQNVSKVVLQNRPNVKALMLDTQVYSNTGGQNSDSSPLPGGYDMNQMGAATQGKLVEKKGVAETLLAGHGSPFVAQISIANAAKFYKAILDALEYRGTAFLQCFTTCQPEHGVGDDVSLPQAQRARDSRGMPEFVFHPGRGETYAEALDLKGNPSPRSDWYETKFKPSGEPYRYTGAHWGAGEARFRAHFREVKDPDAAALVPLERLLVLVTQDDVVHRRFLDPGHRAFVPDFGASIRVQDEEGGIRTLAVSRQMALFCVERRKAWRLLQSKAGLENADYRAQREVLARIDRGELTRAEFLQSKP
jgi:pyruvate-ferredoxin/flavodoxin oxidoreductase